MDLEDPEAQVDLEDQEALEGQEVPEDQQILLQDLKMWWYLQETYELWEAYPQSLWETELKQKTSSMEFRPILGSTEKSQGSTPP